MDRTRQLLVNLSFLSGALLVVYVAGSLLEQVSGAYDLEARIKNADLVLSGTSIFLGVLTFAYLYRSDKINQYMNEVVAELSRVTWPTHNDTVRGTIVVMIMVVIAGFFLGGLDSLWSWALSLVV